jgi:hypothetical protein
VGMVAPELARAQFSRAGQGVGPAPYVGLHYHPMRGEELCSNASNNSTRLLLLAVPTEGLGSSPKRSWESNPALIGLFLASVETTNWGPNQCRNDPDGAVDHSERLILKDVVPGSYHVRLADNRAGSASCIMSRSKPANHTHSRSQKAI